MQYFIEETNFNCHFREDIDVLSDSEQKNGKY